MSDMQTRYPKAMFFAQGGQFEESGIILLCYYYTENKCSANHPHRLGERAPVYQGDDFGLYSVVSHSTDGHRIWFSGGATSNKDFKINLDNLGHKLIPSKAVYTFAEIRGMTRYKREEFDIPEERLMHCFIPVCNGDIFMYGGYSDTSCFTSRLTSVKAACRESQLLHLNASRTAFILRNGSWFRVPDLSPCRYTNHGDAHKATCAMRRLGSSGCEVIIPTFDSVNRKRCTASLDLRTLKWRRLENDVSRKALFGGVALSVANNSRVLYLGGFDEHRRRLKTIHELTSNNVWTLWPDVELPYPVSSKSAPLDYFSMQMKHCKST